MSDALFECDVETLPLFDPSPERPRRPEVPGHVVRGLAERRWLTPLGLEVDRRIGDVWALNRRAR